MKKLRELVLEKVVINDSVLRSLTPVDKCAEVGDIEKNVHCFARIVLQVLGLEGSSPIRLIHLLLVIVDCNSQSSPGRSGTW